MENIGVLYVAAGDAFLKEAAVSAASLKMLHPELPTALFTDSVAKVPDVFDLVEEGVKLKDGFGSKVYALEHSPFDKTVFLDTDTFVCGDIGGLFATLDRFDVGVAHDPFRAVPYIDIGHVPDAFPEPNTGVIAYRRCPEVAALLTDWQKCYEQQEYKDRGWHDQPSFRKALYRSEAKVLILPPEYNARFIYPAFVAAKVKIIHARSRNLARIARIVNSESKPRIYSWSFTDLWRVLRTFPLLRCGRGW